MRKLYYTLVLLFPYYLFSQVGFGTTTLNDDSAIEIGTNTSTKGLLLTRINLVDCATASPLTAHEQGMIVYNLATNGSGALSVTPGFYYNNGNMWIRLDTNPTKIGDIKYSYAISDHSGWYLLNGRAIASLPTNVQNVANGLGMTSNIPDATNRILKAKGAEALYSTGGSNTIVLSQTQLPNVNFTGTTSSDGDHSHNFDDRYHSTDEDLNLVTSLLGILAGIGLNILNTNVGDKDEVTNTDTSSIEGAHTHTATVNSGGSGNSLPEISNYKLNAFVYLGR
ncbi:hypothetical protein [Flavobacterium terrigena]|uniref:Microcystin-dependent protein n=1 Tax=Flavobacterium terrigena TaxID=402734 RepID=A0A1H6QHJ1_9FLAO|nr:hypothetical protein [Flavobacterium terrigena]SEI43191.1 hypothetical protein SAMN05660918_0533 [Flavobacterium terrigena]